MIATTEQARRSILVMRSFPIIAIAALLNLGWSVSAFASVALPRSPAEIKVSAPRDPDARKYKAIVAGLDAFDRHQGLAPAVEVLRFRIAPRRQSGAATAPSAHIIGDNGFSLRLAVDANGVFTAPRSQAALDADAELVLDQKRRLHAAAPVVRTPGLADNVRRLGDLRLECQVWMAIRMEEIGLLQALMVNGILRQRDWCAFLDQKRPGFAFDALAPITHATLREGERSQALRIEGRSYRAPLHDPAWSDEALIELDFDIAPAANEAVTGTAGETPRTAP